MTKDTDIVEQWMTAVRSKGRGRTRYEGQAPFSDETVLAEIERLRADIDEEDQAFHDERAVTILLRAAYHKLQDLFNDAQDELVEQSDEIKRLKDTATAATAAERERVHEALTASREAMATWCATYAPDECSAEHVEAAQKRLMEGGPLWYIATVTDKIDAAIREQIDG